MNKIYRAIWNETTQTWVAASELAKSKTKSDTVSSLPATSQTSSKRRFAAIFKLSLVASFLNLSLLAPNVYASNAALIGHSNMGDNSPTQNYKDKNGNVFASHGSIILNGANDFAATGAPNNPLSCGADEVTGRGDPGRTISGTSITALEEYLRFAEDRSYGGKNPYGTTTSSVDARQAAMQGELTGGAISKMPVAYGVYSFASGCGSYTSGNYSMAFGTNATATAGGAMAIGTAALASGRASIAFGVGAEATGVSSVALGSVASSNGVGSVAAGLMSQASADGTVALGVQAEAKNNSAVAIGNSAQATGEQSISIGSANQVSGKGSGAIGGSNATTQYDKDNGKQTTAASGMTIVTGDGSYSFGNQNGTIAANNTGVFGNRNTIQTDSEGVNKADNIRILGNDNTVTAQAGGAMIVGNAANVSAANGLALGNNTRVSGANGVAIGAGAVAEGENGVALGSGSVASGNVVAIGNASAGITRQITGLAAGTLDTDAVNVAQLKSLDASTSTSISSLSSSTSTSLSALEDGFTNLSTSTSSSILEATKELKSISTSVDGHISSTGATLTELQTSASASILELRNNALQWNNEVQAYDAAHLASGAKTAKIINVQAGDITTKDSTDAVNGGQLYTTNSNLSSLSLSVSSSINELSDKLVSSNTTDIISLSTMASSIGDTVGKLQKDALQWKDGSYSADHGTGKAQIITNVSAGHVTPDSTDAINGSQLHSLSTVTQSGLSTATSGLNSLSVSTATGLNSLSSSINSSLSNATEGVTELKQNALQWNSNIGAYDAARNGNIQKITNVAAGTLGENSTDAVNAGQLFSLSNSTSTGLSSLSSSLSTITENQMGDMSGTVSRLNENVSSLSTGLSTIDGNVTALQQNALQWNGKVYDATRDGSTQTLTGITAGRVEADSTDAINGSQLHSLSTVTQSGLSTATSGLNSLSLSTATGLNSLSSSINSSLSNATEGVTELKQNALQWNSNIGAYDAARNGNIQKITNVAAGTLGENSTDAVNAGQLFSLSNSTSTGLSSLSSSLSTITENQMGDMSGTVSRLNENVSSLSTGLSTIDGNVTALQQNALQWNGKVYDATRDGSTQTLTGITAGRVEADSTDAINGSQLHSLSTVTQSGLSTATSGLNSLSVSTATGLNSLSSSINSSLSNATEGVTELKQNALQWNSNIGAYDAARNGNIQKITNVAAGTLGENSTDAVNAGQLFSLSNSTSTGLSSLSSSLSTITENQMGDMSGTVSRLNENVSSLSTGLSTIDGNVTALQQNALQWNGKVYDATRDGSTQTLTGITAGRVEADSTDAINGSQLHSLSTVTQSGLSTATSGLNSLSLSTATGLNSLSSSINSSLSNATEGVTELKQNALQWNNNIGAYDAARNGNIQKITNVAAGTLGENSTDAINAGQLFSLSNSTSTGLSSLSSSLSTITENQMGDMSGTVSRLNENVSSLSTGLSTIDGNVTALQQNALQWNGKVYDATRDGSTQTLTGITAGRVEADSTDAINGSQLHSLSTVTQSGLSTATSGLNSLSVSTATGLNSLSSSINSSLSNATEGVTELKQNALQWNSNIGAYDAARNGNIQKITNVAAGTLGENSTDAVNAGQLFSLSNSTSTGLSSLSSSLSTITENQMGDMSGTVSRLNENVSSLSTGLSTIDGNVTALQQNALQWNGKVYDATRDGSTQTLTGITAGRVEADSTDAINGSQLHSLSTVTQSGLSTATSGLNSLSLSTATGLNSLSSSINSSLSNATEGVTELKQNALQWNSNIGAYDAARNGNIQKITNVAAGTLGENSTDAVNAGQLFSLSNSTSTGLSSLSSSLSTITENQMGDMSGTVSRLNENVSSLSTGLSTIDGNVTALQQNALQWNGKVYDATRDGSTQTLTGITAGRVEADSTDAINGSQLHSLSTVTQSGLSTATSGLNSLSLSTATGLNSLSSSINSSLSNATEGVTELKQNALQWNSNIGAYDAARNGNIQKITNVAAGTLGENSTDAVNAGQLFSLSNSTSTGLSSLSSSLSTITENQMGDMSGTVSRLNENVSSLSTGLSTIDGNVTALQQNALQWNGKVYDATRDGSTQTLTGITAGRVEADSTDAINGSQLHSLSTVTQSGLSTATSGLNSLSLSTATGLNSLSSSINSSLSNATEGVTELKQNALQWNSNIGAYDAARNGNIQKITNVAAGTLGENSTDAINAGQLFSLSNSTSTGLSSLSSSLSTITENQMGDMSGTVSRLNENVSSLSTGLSTIDGNVTALQQNALQWNGKVYDATRDGSTQTLTGITAGRVEADSTDAINGSQLHSLSTVTQSGLSTATSGLNSLSLSTATGLNSLSSSINSSLSNATEGVTELKQNALQWNSNIGAYDAARNGNIQKITNVAAGTLGENSTDAVNAGQLFSLSNSTSTGLSSLSSSLSTITENQLGDMSGTVSRLNENVSSLSTGLSTIDGSVTALQQNALQWNGQVYDATREGSTQKLTGIKEGRVEADSTDAINGSQLHSLSTVTQSGLDDAASGLSSLSVSTATGLNSLSSSMNSVNQSLTTLQQDALQWNSNIGAYDASRNGDAKRITNVAAGILGENSTDAVNAGQLFKLSNSTSTGLSSLSTAVSDIGSISVSMSTGYNELLSSLSTTQDQLGQLETSTNNKLTSLDTNYQNIRNDVDKLRENSLKWNNDLGNGEGGFDASRPNSLTRAPSYGKIVNLADGSLEPDSHEAVNGGQLRIVKDDLLSLSSSTSTGLSSLASMMANTSTNALQWNSNIDAYDATHNGTAQRITNVAAGLVGENSTDAINGHQLWEVRNDLNSLSTTVNNLPTGGNISQDALNSLSTSISASVASQIASMSSALGGTKQSNSDGSNQPSYNVSLASSGDIFSHDIYTHDGSKKTVTNVRDALQGIQENGTKYESINSMKTQAKATGMESIAIGGDAMASGASAIAIGDSASAPESNSVAMGQGAKSQKAGGVALGAGSVADRAGNRRKGNVYIPETATDSQAKAILATESDEYGAVSVGNAKEGQYRQITGVAAGTEDSDAVNVAQLKGVNNQIGNINKYVNKINERVQRTERRAYSGTALAMALSGAYLPSLNAGEQAVGVGVGTYRGYTAVGANYKAISNSGNVGWGAGVSTTGKEVGFNAGVGFKWGGN